MIPVEKPGSPTEILEHHGTKGMKWGVRQSRQMSKEFGRQFPTGQSRAQEIHRARLTVAQNRLAIDRAKTPEARKEAAKVYLKNPDRATAKRLTRGEKVTVGVLAGVFGVTGIVPAAVGGAIIGTHAHRRIIERKQRQGAYN